MRRRTRASPSLEDLLEQWTRAEIMARLASLPPTDYANYYVIKMNLEDDIRQLLFGTKDLVQLGLKWNMLKRYKSKRGRASKCRPSKLRNWAK